MYEQFIHYFSVRGWFLQKQVLRSSLDCKMLFSVLYLWKEGGKRIGQRKKLNCEAGLTKPQVNGAHQSVPCCAEMPKHLYPPIIQFPDMGCTRITSPCNRGRWWKGWAGGSCLLTALFVTGQSILGQDLKKKKKSENKLSESGINIAQHLDKWKSLKFLCI